ncbi:hypothetical protein PG994_001780 [Apiospora phragmitis]|uniref:Uncharacterized protein n=1 Tax=Apiospora phragmitis TaxID=2905665 RepID=A0ABR1WUH2_9PEZI
MAAGDDETMPDAPAPKPRRRFAPQLVEESVKSSTPNRDKTPDQNHSLSQEPEAEKEATRTTKDASVQVDDIPMADAPPTQARRRFAPVPIETTFDSYRVNKNPHGPTAELTPDPSPTSSYAPHVEFVETIEPNPEENKPKRRFAPQLIETSRRARRAGQQGPATKHTDKTDITPGTNHIYAPKPKKNRPPPSARNDDTTLTEDEEEGGGPSRYLTPRRQGSMKPHPNTRRSTPKTSFHMELDTIASSESDDSSEGNNDDTRDVDDLTLGAPAREVKVDQWEERSTNEKNRRESLDEDVSGYLLAVAASEAHRQRELESALSAFPNGVPALGVEHFYVRDNSEEFHYSDSEEEPLRHGTSKLIRRKSTDLPWAVKEMRQYAEKHPHFRFGSDMSVDTLSDDMDLPPEDPLWTTGGPTPESLDQHPPESDSPSTSHVVGKPLPPTTGPATKQPEVPGFRKGPFGNPFATFGNDDNEKDDGHFREMRNAAAPPMLGSDLKFRMCPSPKATRMEPDHPWPTQGACRPEEKIRDTSGETGLWRGYCVAQANEVTSALQQGPDLLATPSEPATLHDPFAAAFTESLSLGGSNSSHAPASPTKRTSKHGGLHMVAGLDERIQKEMARKEREDRIAAEFDDAFITQVYNYLSLGYPATARAYDEELCKITGVAVSELRRNDGKKIEKGFMLEMQLNVKSGFGSQSSADTSGDEEMVTPEEDEKRCADMPPRWTSLRLYIREWARQHPDLENNGASLAWGVRARRGSWAV